MNKLMTTIGKIVYNNRIIISIILLVFTLGFLIGTAASVQKTDDLSTQFIINEQQPNNNNHDIIQISYDTPQEKASPQDRIPQENILVYNDRVIINIDNPEWATFTDTNSMDPVIDAGSNAIEIIPKDASELRVGDIISYESEYATGTIIHRINEIGQDADGWYCKAKGDNIQNQDPGKIRFNQIRRVVVAIIY